MKIKEVNSETFNLEQVLFDSGLPQVLGIEKDLKNSREGVFVLAGILKEIVEGDVLDPIDITHWKKEGKRLMGDFPNVRP